MEFEKVGCTVRRKAENPCGNTFLILLFVVAVVLDIVHVNTLPTC